MYEEIDRKYFFIVQCASLRHVSRFLLLWELNFKKVLKNILGSPLKEWRWRLEKVRPPLCHNKVVIAILSVSVEEVQLPDRL